LSESDDGFSKKTFSKAFSAEKKEKNAGLPDVIFLNQKSQFG
jgi:hypothetical protein